MSGNVVVDASFALKWVLVEQYSNEARAHLRSWASTNTVVLGPSWLACETTNVLYQQVRSGTLTRAGVQAAISALLAVVTLRDAEPAVSLRAVEIADQTGQKASYDSHYAALAEHERCELWTADEAFWRATHARFPFVRFVTEPISSP
ncbi:MAG: type II toxin-antitoxin system VapC family toxin [Chloroflexi bacterium]|nr:type II toxin-antitoxin system VapC family toxin [Chloroflexota bacterium]